MTRTYTTKEVVRILLDVLDDVYDLAEYDAFSAVVLAHIEALQTVRSDNQRG